MSSEMTFVAFDTETANSSRASICSLGATVVTNGVVTDERSWLIRPPEGHDEFFSRNVSIHGITPEMVQDKPRFGELWPEISQYLDGHTVVAHNASFDTSVVRYACETSGHPWPEWTYGCTLIMARQALDLVSYRLPIVASHLGVPLERHHDAAADARACAGVLLALADRNECADLTHLTAALTVNLGRLFAGGWDPCRQTRALRSPSHAARGPLVIPEASIDADPDHPLYGQVVVFTGGLGSMTRQDACDAVANVGATPAKGLTRKTTVLVIGDGFRGDDLAEFQTGKARKALELRAKGQPIEVITEDELLELLTIERNTSASVRAV